MAQNSAFKSAPIIHTPRADLRDAVRQEIKALGAEKVVVPLSRDNCIEELIRSPDSILVLDWEIGSIDVNQILSACKGHFHIETRPTFLVVANVDPHIIATGYEYGVSQIHSGPISRLTIKECLHALLHEDEMAVAIKEVLLRVADIRSRDEWALATPILAEIYGRYPDNERLAVELAENLISDENWPEAKRILGPYMDREPAVIRALHLMGRCLMHEGDYDRAIGLLSRAKIVNPHNVDRLIELGNAFLTNNQVSDALQIFDEAVQIESTSKEALVGKGQCLLLTGEVNEALSLLKEMSGPREMASIFNTAAVLAMRSGNFDKGMGLYRSALMALGRNDKIASRLYFNMGLGFNRQNKLEKALTCFVKSHDLDRAFRKASKYKETIEAKLASSRPSGDTVQGSKELFQEEEFNTALKPLRPTNVPSSFDEELEPEGFDD